MGVAFSRRHNFDTPNTISGLSPRDIDLVQKSWKPIYKNKVANGTIIFKKLFTESQEAKDFFKMLHDVPISELDQSVQFRAHVIHLMTTFNMAVTHLHEPEVVTVMMHKIGNSHNENKIRKRHFMVLQEVLVQVFKDELKLDESTLAAWGRTFEFWYRGIFEKLDE